MALGLLLVVMIVSVVIQMGFQSTALGQKISKIRYEMGIVESQIRLELRKPLTYNSCAQVPPDNNWSCILSANFKDRFTQVMTGAKCPTAPCGVLVKNVDVLEDPVQPKVSVVIAYNGNETRVSQASFVVDIPKEALNGRSGLCGSDLNGDGLIDGYLYKGIKSDGSDDCRGLPSCPDGQYLVGLKDNGSPDCKSFLSSSDPYGLKEEVSGGPLVAQCPTAIGGGVTHFLKGLKFLPNSSGSPVSIDCGTRIDPCAVSNGLCPVP